MYTAEIAWHGGNDLRIVRGTVRDGNEIISALAAARSLKRQEQYMQNVIKNRPHCRSRNGR